MTETGVGNSVVLYRDEEPVREWALDGGALEVGSGAGCDIVVHDPAVPERHLLVEERGGTVMAYELGRGSRGLADPRPFPLGKGIALGPAHRLVRVPRQASPPVRPRPASTEPIGHRPEASCTLVLLIGHGASTRHLEVGARPISIGASPDNDVVLADRAVSGFHCRIEPGAGAVLVRDLRSTNGTWVDGVRVVGGAKVERAGARLRVGRTDLRLVPRGEPGDARATGMIAASAAMLGLLGEVERLAGLSWPVLIVGESGSGKEGIARALHLRGPRASKPWVTLNCGALAPTLVEAEFFGHERGAFTGAERVKRGVFEQADAGTLFLDEIGELPLEAQARLLRVLETGRVRRVGGEEETSVEVRLICATHRDLPAMVEEGTFREDLFYRVTRLVLEVPPLRERPEDVRALAAWFLSQAADEVGPRALADEALDVLLAHDWPGNARELRNVICTAAAGTGTGRIERFDVERALRWRRGPAPVRAGPEPATMDAVLARHRGNVTAAARALGVPRSTLRDRVRRTSGT